MTADEFSTKNMALREAIAKQDVVVNSAITKVREETDKLNELKNQLADLHLEREEERRSTPKMTKVNTRVDLSK